MPGSSLWLVPPPSHPLHAIITKLISTIIPSLFPASASPSSSSSATPSFSPHLTLTSEINPAIYGADPQAWLDSIPFPPAHVKFERVMTQDVFFRRCYLKCAFDGVRGIVGIARARGVAGEDTVGVKTEVWLSEWKAAFGPHVSLLYGDMPIDKAKLEEVEQAVREAGVGFGGSDGIGGWEGGTVWLVPTDRPIGDWKPIAIRTL